MLTQSGVSPAVGSGAVLFSMIVYTLLYAALAVVEVGLIMRAVKIGPPEDVVLLPEDQDADSGAPLTFAY